ncbi:hypothetical protein N7510_009351 [Penicillium lagena]|uniref:uncharacterized protein n=1 Tax=Penicillium lagena TaxID=94218 RepID=UPI00253F84A4|nr:uncharacterized protein N7510_009351 [Penicillium lagena]KAJ5606570.1 hypothetical protein N7510_009351 [Penicillium lagena]
MARFLATFLFTSYVGANLAYKSRPDLAVPVLNITIPATNEAWDGLIFYTPESIYADDTNHGPAQSGPYIYTDKGELVWTGFGFVGPRSENFQVHTYRGQQVLGIFEDQHEFLFFDDNSATFTVFDPEIRDLTPYGGTENQSWILDNKIQKVDTDTNQLLWEWSSLDHINPAGTNLTLQSGNAGLGVNSSQVWHYFYMNAFDVDPKTNTYLLSARSMCTIFKMDGNTGDIIWQLGGKHSDFSQDFDFCWQHDTRMHQKYLHYETKGSKEIISFFDNSAHENLSGGPILQTRAYSEGKVVELDTAKRTARLIASFRAPGDLSVKSQGNVQLLPNGNAFINWGYDGAMSEHKPDGTTIFFTGLDSGKLGPGSENYRAFKFDWHALPFEEPALVAFKEEDSAGTSLYVSWNGDTETKIWRFFEKAADGRKTLLGQTKRTGFETTFRTNKRPSQVVAEAYDAHDKQLVSSPAVKTREYRARLHYQD